jgi:hypothetical protein
VLNVLQCVDIQHLSRRGLLGLGGAGLAAAAIGWPLEASAGILPSNQRSQNVVPERAFLGQGFGAHVVGGGVGNTMFQERHAHRFRAEATGPVRYVAFYMRYDKSGHQKAAHYSIGNGGRLQIEIQSDDDGMPSGKVLGYTDEIADPVKLRTMWPRLAFRKMPYIEQGSVYHIVYRQLDRKRGLVSVNDLHTYFQQKSVKSCWEPQQVQASLAYDGRSRRWRDRPDRIPVYELGMQNGVWFGQGMMAGGRFETGKVGGSDQVMQTFRATDRARTFKGMRFTLHKHAGTSTDLLVDILRADGRTQATFEVDAKQVTTSDGDLEKERTNPWRWVEVDFRDPVRLGVHDTLGVRFRSKRPGYKIMTMQNGAQSKLEIRENKLGNLGYACHSTDAGRNFTKGWRSKLNPDNPIRADMQMPLLLLTV